MKKTLTYSGFILSGLILLLSTCLFLIKIDYVQVCYFSNDGGSTSLLVDKQVNEFVQNKKDKHCFIFIDKHKYRCYLTYDQMINNDYQYWLSINSSDDLPIMNGAIQCNFGGITMIKYLL